MTEENELENLENKKFELRNLIDYQKGSIVSRTLIDKPNGSITLFAIDKNQTISKHSAPHDAVATILEGKAKFKVENEEHKLKEGETLAIKSGQQHSLSAPKKFKMILTMIE